MATDPTLARTRPGDVNGTPSLAAAKTPIAHTPMPTGTGADMSSTFVPRPAERVRETVPTSTRRPDQGTSPPLGPRLVAEFIGTFFLVITVCAATTPKTGAGTLAPLAIGAILMAMVFAGGHISGGHYNPAMSFAVMIRGKLGVGEWLGYTAAQLAAGAAGGLAACGLVGHRHPGATAGTAKILAVELLFTFALAYVVLNVATARINEGNSYFGLAIGFTVTAGAFAVGGISGGAFNPAVALGVSVLGRFAWARLWIYIVAALAGAAIAATAFLYTQPSERPGSPTSRRRPTPACRQDQSSSARGRQEDDDPLVHDRHRQPGDLA